MPKRGTEPEKAGWKLVAKVDTRPKEGDAGGQYGVNIADSATSIGHLRYLLFDISKTEDADPFGNTFYSEIDVIDKAAPAVAEAPLTADASTDHYDMEGGKYQFTIMTSDAPDLTDWTRKVLAPTVQKWYPLIIKTLPSPGYEAPKRFSIEFTNQYHGVAATAGTKIMCSPDWYRNNILPKGQGPGSVVHELVHVVQQYGRARRTNPNYVRPPGWLIEGIPDYIRWFLYEPESHGADITASRLAKAKYDGKYRISANFLNWATDKYDKDLVPKLNAALREGAYNDETWKNLTKHTIEELNDEWRKALADKLGVPLPAPPAPPAAAAATAPTATTNGRPPGS